ncbi:phosphatase PAP2 family protein [Streptomyces sp. SCSIO 30461]|uniref:phosphatase PAP2 family protein n=1 Tax=Streptomyces sp. SCSIO 30461 TaxID=3118085 RepID=UPI0030CDE337
MPGLASLPYWVHADQRLLTALRDCGRDQRVAAVARAFSHGGEHGAVWLAAGLVCAAADRERRQGWLRGTALVGAAHLASMGVKRLVRRPRPRLPCLEPLVKTLSRHSFPSSHATAAAAATVAFGALRPAGGRLVPPLAAAVCVSRLVVGVHYPTDVAAGALLGGLTARLGAGWLRSAPVAGGRARGRGRGDARDGGGGGHG